MNKLKKIIASFLVSISLLGIMPVVANAEWKSNSTGWWYTNGNSWDTGWNYIDGNWYYFKYNGYMKTGWIKYDDTWYYLNSSGALDNSMTTKTMPTQNYTYEQCEQIANASFSNSHQKGYKFKVVSNKKLYDNGTYYFTIYSLDLGKDVDAISVSSITGEILE